jgi:hypothetical protein
MQDHQQYLYDLLPTAKGSDNNKFIYTLLDEKGKGVGRGTTCAAMRCKKVERVWRRMPCSMSLV